MTTQLGLALYAVLVNVITCAAMGADKRAAQKGRYRTPERTLFLLAAMGGAIGGVIGMRVFRHKTKHILFNVAFPLLVLIQVALAVIGLGCNRP